jgi:hypothetical protein
VARRKHPESEIDPAQHRAALTRVYLRMACPETDNSTRTKLADSILALIDGGVLRVPQTKITGAQAVEMVWRHTRRNIVSTKQLAGMRASQEPMDNALAGREIVMAR